MVWGGEARAFREAVRVAVPQQSLTRGSARMRSVSAYTVNVDASGTRSG